MVPGMGAQPVPVKEWVAANDNGPKLWGCEKKKRGEQKLEISDHYRGAVDSWMAAPDWDGIVKTAADRFSAVHETLAKSERGQYIGLTRHGDPNGCDDDLATTTFAPLEELPGWIEWDGGGPMPVGPDDRVTIKLRNGLTNVGPAVVFNWLHGRGGHGYEGDDDIISYRVLSTAPRPSSADTGRHGDFMQTYTGRKFWPMDPRANEVCIRDIAHSLSLQCRYAGHCRRFLSVAEHSVLIARWVRGQTDAQTALWGLLHDASEAYLVDIPRPVKPYLTNYKEAEAKVMAAVCQRFGLPLEMPAAVHEADERIIADELVNLVRMQWHARHDDPLGVRLMYWSPAEAEEEFLETFKALTGAVGEVG
jgi:hypothetical protein